VWGGVLPEGGSNAQAAGMSETQVKRNAAAKVLL